MFILLNVYVSFDVNQYTNRVAIDKLDLNGTKMSFFLIFQQRNVLWAPIGGVSPRRFQ